jgi:predicted metal-dependent phosphoesterase TrpH
MMHNAGGKAVLAHPAFLAFKYQLSLKEIFADLRKHGLDGVEAEYPYSLTAKQLSEHRSISDVISEIQELAKQFGLFTTRGSDAHDPHTLTEFATH